MTERDRAVECADEEDRFAEMAEELFAKQDSFGLKPWVSYAQDAGATDSARFVQCLDEDATGSRIDQGQRLAEALAVQGTPTVIINGWRYPFAPPKEVLEEIVHEVLAGRSPFPDG